MAQALLAVLKVVGWVILWVVCWPLALILWLVSRADKRHAELMNKMGGK